MTQLFLVFTQADRVVATELQRGLGIDGYALWRPPLRRGSQVISPRRSSERGILGSAALMLVWSEPASQDEEVKQQLLFAQQINRPIFLILLDQTALPESVVQMEVVLWRGSGLELSAALRADAQFPAAQSTDPFVSLCEQAMHEDLYQRKEAIAQAASMLQHNQRREDVQTLLKYLLQYDLMMSVRELAKEALRADAVASQARVQRQPEEPVILSDEPLAESETSISLEIVSGAKTWRGKAEQEETEGRITLNPQSNLLYALSPLARSQEILQRTATSTAWDFYLVNIPFTLHKAPGKSYYRDVTFIVELEQAGSTAFDLFPTDITASSHETTSYTVSSEMRIERVEDLSKDVQGTIHFKTLYPLITTFGEGEQRFYWRYEGSQERKEVPPGTKHALIVLRVPQGTLVVDGMIHYKITLAKHLQSLWSNRESVVAPYPIRWVLGKTVPAFQAPQALSENAGRSLRSQQEVRIDVCLLCALPEEAEGLKEAFRAELGVSFRRAYHARLQREYDYATLPNGESEELGILVTWLPHMGPLETSLQLRPLLEVFKPRFAAMTGICAGDREQVKLGDIIVAERTFLYDAGKFVRGEHTQQRLRHDIQTWSPPSNVIHFARGFRGWEQVVASELRPPTRQQQRDWLLQTLLALRSAHREGAPQIDDIALADLELYAPEWRTIVWTLQNGPEAYLTSDRRLKDEKRVADLRYGKEPFPYQDPQQPGVFIAPVASGNAVRSDRPFAEIKEPVRGTLAIDMEGAAFYRTLADFPHIHYLFVKGVSDYADEEKDDSYHAYASKISARYILAFIRAYVTTRRLPCTPSEQM